MKRRMIIRRVSKKLEKSPYITSEVEELDNVCAL